MSERISSRRRRARSRTGSLLVAASPLVLATALSCKGETTAPSPPTEASSEAPAAEPPKAAATQGTPEQPAQTSPTLLSEGVLAERAAERADAEARLAAAKTSDEKIEALTDFLLLQQTELIPAAAAFVTDPDDAVATQAISTIEILGGDESIKSLRGLLARPDLSQARRIRLLEGLFYVRTEGEVLPVFAPVLDDPDPVVRLEAAQYVGALGEDDGLPLIEKRLATEQDPKVKKSLDWAARFLRGETKEGPASE